MFDGENGQRLYEAALGALPAEPCPQCKVRFAGWRFSGYEPREIPGQQPRELVVRGLCTTEGCGYMRTDNADGLEEALSASSADAGQAGRDFMSPPGSARG
jgi:hypothetical protein